MKLPKDPYILLGFVNMKLRDFYCDLAAFCEDNEINRQQLCQTLAAVGYRYDPDCNAFCRV